MEKQYWKPILIAAAFIAAGICYYYQKEDAAVFVSQAEQAVTEGLPLNLSTASEPEAAEYVYICGEVHSPGVYEVKKGSRIFQVVEMAGGFTDDAQPLFLNLAEVVRDGMKITVYSKDQQAEAGFLEIAPEESAKVNLNTAVKEQLMTLKGIGEARADEIIRYREEYGPFQKVEDVMKVPGIKESSFEKIRDSISV